jgi:hypothetical protein
MGGAYTAIADNAMALFYNDAGLANQNSLYSTWNHSNLLLTDYEFTGVTFPLKNAGTIGGSFILLKADFGDIVPVDPDGNIIKKSDYYELSLKLGYGIAVVEGVNIGLGGKFIRINPSFVLQRVLGIEDANNTFAFDFSLLITPATLMFSNTGEKAIANLLEEFRIGISYQNFGPDIRSKPLPRTLRWGIGFKKDFVSHPVEKGDINLIGIALALDQTNILTNTPDPPWTSLGGEVSLIEIAAFRAGYFRDKVGRRIGWTWGLGFESTGIVKLLALPRIIEGFTLNWSDDSDIFSFPIDDSHIEIGYQYQP